MAMRPFVIGLVVVFSGSGRGGRVIKLPCTCAEAHPFPGNISRLQPVPQQIIPVGSHEVGEAGLPNGKAMPSAQLSSPGSLGSWTPGMAMQKAQLRRPDHQLLPQCCNLLPFLRILPGCALLNTLVTVFGVPCSDGDTGCSGCFQLLGQPCLSVTLATSLQALAGLQQEPHPLSAFLTLSDV